MMSVECVMWVGWCRIACRLVQDDVMWFDVEGDGVLGMCDIAWCEMAWCGIQ